MVLSILLSILTIVASIAAFSAWHAHARLRERHAYIDALHERESFVLDTMRDCIEASRISTEAVIGRLSHIVRQRDPGIDAFLVFTPEGEDLACVFAEGARTDHYRTARLRREINGSLPARAALAGHRIAEAGGLLIPNDRRGLAVPMLDRSGLHGVVYVSSSTDAQGTDDESIVRAIEHAASPFALALERESDRANATYDGLTGLLAPRAFRTRLRDEVARARFRSTPLLSLWFIDTDHFKVVNDEHGHAAGDRVLQAMATLLRSQMVDELDVAARNGGDEFCALIFGSQKTVAIERAQAFCDAVRTFDFGLPVSITASVGVASFPFDAQDASELLEVADAAMYFSKRGGRDRVSFAVEGGAFCTYR